MRSWLKIVTVVPISVIAVLLLLELTGLPTVRLANDLDFDVTIRGCEERRRIPAGAHLDMEIAEPCQVYRPDGNWETYLGCLSLSEGAFDGDATLVSTLNPEISYADCRYQDDYRHHGRAWRLVSRVGDLLGR